MSLWSLFIRRSAIVKCVYCVFLHSYMFLVLIDRIVFTFSRFLSKTHKNWIFQFLLQYIERMINSSNMNVYAYGKQQGIFHIRQMSHSNWSVQCTVTKGNTNSYPFRILYARFLTNVIILLLFLFYFIWWWFAFYYNIQYYKNKDSNLKYLVALGCLCVSATIFDIRFVFKR